MAWAMCVFACSPASRSSPAASGPTNHERLNNSRRIQVFPLAGDRIKLRQHIAHRAEFILRIAAAVGAKDLFDLLRVERRETILEVGRHFHRDVQAPACCQDNDARPAGRP